MRVPACATDGSQSFLEGTGLSLSHAVKLSLKSFRPKTASIPLSDAIRGFLSAQKDRGAAEKTIVGYQSFLRLLTEGLPLKINVHEIAEQEVRNHLAKYEKPASRNATIRLLSMDYQARLAGCRSHGTHRQDPRDRRSGFDSHRVAGAKAPRGMRRRPGMSPVAGRHCHRPFCRAPHQRTRVARTFI
jgi:hypothetical protein